MQSDEINNPQHYQLFPDMQAIDVIKATLSPEEFTGYLKGNYISAKQRKRRRCAIYSGFQCIHG